jgi:hypothetical protein
LTQAQTLQAAPHQVVRPTLQAALAVVRAVIRAAAVVAQ